jgi:hypothetical protein
MLDIQIACGNHPDIHLHSHILEAVGDLPGLIFVILTQQEHGPPIGSARIKRRC